MRSTAAARPAVGCDGSLGYRRNAKSPTAAAATLLVCRSAGLEVSSLGLGAWSWGDRSRYWQSDIDRPSNLTVGAASRPALRRPRIEPACSASCKPGAEPSCAPHATAQAYKAMVASGIDFLDTGELPTRQNNKRRAPHCGHQPFSSHTLHRKLASHLRPSPACPCLLCNPPVFHTPLQPKSTALVCRRSLWGSSCGRRAPRPQSPPSLRPCPGVRLRAAWWGRAGRASSGWACSAWDSTSSTGGPRLRLDGRRAEPPACPAPAARLPACLPQPATPHTPPRPLSSAAWRPPGLKR